MGTHWNTLIVSLCTGALLAVALLKVAAPHLSLQAVATRNAVPIKTAVFQEPVSHRLSRTPVNMVLAATRNPMEDLPTGAGVTSSLGAQGLALMAGVSAMVGAVVMKFWGQRGQEQRVSLLAATGRRSMALYANPMNCRSVPRDEPGYRYLGSTEIPFPVPRMELIDSMQQWAANELREQLEDKFFGYKLVVDYEDDRITEENAFSLTVRFTSPSGEYVVLEYCLDNEVVQIGRTIEGFVVEANGPQILDAQGNPDPRSITMMGTEGEVSGRYFMVRRKEGPLADELRPIVAEFLKETAMALTRYYAFGSLFLDDAL